MNQLKTIALLALLTGLMMALGYGLMGSQAGIWVGLALAAPLNLAAWYFSDRIALQVYQAVPADAATRQRVQPMLERLCDRAQLPVPQLYVVPTTGANAFATGRDPSHAAISLTEGILELLPDDELEGVIAHELSHIRHWDTLTQTITATVAGALTFFADLFRSSPFQLQRRRRIVGFLILGLCLLLAPLIALVIRLGISRVREFAADAGAANLTGNPQALARALERLQAQANRMPPSGSPAFAPLLIVNAFSERFLETLFSTHPATELRIQRLIALNTTPFSTAPPAPNAPAYPSSSSPHSQSASSMTDPDNRISEDMAPEVLELAARLQAQRQQTYSVEELTQAAGEAQISPEALQEALQTMQNQATQQDYRRRQNARRLKQGGFVAVGFLVAIALWGILTYNGLTGAAATTDAKWAQVENQLQRRADLIPNLVAVAQSASENEKEIVALLVQAREAYLQADAPAAKTAAIAQINQYIQQFQTAAAANPALQSNQLWINLQYEIAGTENRIAVERKRYNEAVETYNQKLKTFPTVLIASSLGFQPKDFFQASNLETPTIPAPQ